MRTKRLQKWFAVLCVTALLVSTLPLIVISFYNHPYYDDYGFSAGVHKVWKETGNLLQTLGAAFESAGETRQLWQGTYTGTILSNLQPGLFSEDLYWIGNVFLIVSFIACLAFFFCTVFGALGLSRTECISLSCLALVVMIQFMPDAGEAFYWFNGGIGNTFVYALLALAAALTVRLLRTKGRGVCLTAALALLAVALGGGSYGGGLFGLCMAVCLLVWLFAGKHAKRWQMAAVCALFLGCFVYSMSAPGNTVRAGMIGYQSSAVRTVLMSFIHGAAQAGSYVRLPLLAATLMVLPAFLRAASESRFAFRHPWLWIGLGFCLYCTQFAPPLYSIASIGAGRIVNTYFISFVALWFLAVYYLAGFAVKTLGRVQMDARRFGALLLAGLCLFGMGALGCCPPGEDTYGLQNLTGPSAAVSLLKGEAAQYDREMTQREVLLNDESLPVVTLEPLIAVPEVLMEDLVTPDAVYDVRPSLCLYYGKQAILLPGEEE